MKSTLRIAAAALLLLLLSSAAASEATVVSVAGQGGTYRTDPWPPPLPPW